MPYVEAAKCTFVTLIDQQNRLSELFGFKAVPNVVVINEDGTINEPNLLDTSIGNVQQAFESNQNLQEANRWEPRSCKPPEARSLQALSFTNLAVPLP